MEILFSQHTSIAPKVSIVLLDWSCRESFHFFRYMENQTVPRSQYEIIWIEYYNRRPSEIEAGLKECEKLGKPPILDKWIVMDISENIYYHKHLMYNLGIIVSRGEIVTFCDSDAIASPTFVDSIIKAFEEDKNVVLHMDEVRNTEKRFYPFNDPSIEEIIGEGCINWKNGKTTGLLDTIDPLHTRNYGACMCSLRDDLIAIGGADEYIDYLGHICGPYEMTFRLINTGKKEVWHEKEFLYHVWHPGTDGRGNYLGPHDGRHMSTTALEALKSSRTLPLLENPAIRTMRLKTDMDITEDSLLSLAFEDRRIKNWMIDEENIRVSSDEVADNLRSHLLSNLGWAYYLKKNYSEAVDSFNKAIALNKINYKAICGRAWAYLLKANFDNALRDFNKALTYIKETSKNDFQEALRGRGWVYYQIGDFSKAVEDFNRALENIDSEDKKARFEVLRGRSWAYYKMGMIKESIEDFHGTGVSRSLNPHRARIYLLFQILKSNIKRELKKFF